jgi:hypothetical protein
VWSWLQGVTRTRNIIIVLPKLLQQIIANKPVFFSVSFCPSAMQTSPKLSCLRQHSYNRIEGMDSVREPQATANDLPQSQQGIIIGTTCIDEERDGQDNGVKDHEDEEEDEDDDFPEVEEYTLADIAINLLHRASASCDTRHDRQLAYAHQIIIANLERASWNDPNAVVVHGGKKLWLLLVAGASNVKTERLSYCAMPPFKDVVKTARVQLSRLHTHKQQQQTPVQTRTTPTLEK